VTYSILGRDELEQGMRRAVAAVTQPRGRRPVLLHEFAPAPQFFEAARRFGKAGPMPAEVIEGVVPEHV
jgi:hypothetical protein